MSFKGCTFTPKGSSKALSYDEMRVYLMENYDLVEPPVEPPVSEGEPEGKRRKASRAKRIEAEHNQAYKDVLDDYVSMYESVNVEKAKELAQGYYSELQGRVASGELTRDQAQKMAFDYVNSLLEEDNKAGIESPKHPLHKTAFAMMLGQRMLAESIELGNSEWATKWNNFFDFIGREGGTRAAMLDSVRTLDPLANLLSEINAAQEKELSKTVASGRKKGTIVKEIQEEAEKINKEAADEAVETTAVDSAIDKATEEKPPVERKPKEPSKRAQLEKREKAAIDRVKKAFSNKSAPGPLMILSPQNKERLAALVELAKVEIEKGSYTSSEVVSAIFKKVGQYVSKKAIREAVESEWDSLSELAEKQKQEDLIDLVKDAIAGKSSDKIMKALAKALQISHPGYIAAKSKKSRITEKKALEEILSNPEQAKEILFNAMQVIRNEVAAGKHLDLAGGTKPSSLSQEEWDLARGKRVIAQFQQIVDSVLGEAQTRSDESARRQEERKQEKLRSAWEKAKDKREEALKRQREKTEKKELERLANKELKEAEKALKEVDRAYEKDAREKENWIKAKDRRDAAREKAKQKEIEREAERRDKKAVTDAERELKEAEEAYNKARRQEIKQIIKDYYGTKNTAQSLQEFIAERSPDLSMQQINDIASAVEKEMDKIKKSRDNAKIKRLVGEITKGREDADLSNIVGRVMKTRGMMSQFGFANALSGFLGFKGVSQQHINQMAQLMRVASQMMPGQGRQGVIQAANNIAAIYAQSNLRVLNDVMQEVMVRNILSAPRTVFTGGFSVFLSSVPALVKSFAVRPVKTYRGVKFAISNARAGRSAIRASMREIFGEHKIPVSRELPADDDTFSKERAWQRTRNLTLSELRKIWKQDKSKAITYSAAKALIHLSLQGKGTGLTNYIFDLQTALDYLNVTALRDIYASIQAERDLAAKGIFSKDPRFAQEMADMLGTSPQKQAKIEAQINDEVADMVGNGVAIPKDYAQKRRRQLLNENTDLAVLEKAHEKAVDAIGMNEPSTVAGSFAYWIINKIALSEQLRNDTLNIAGFAYARLMQPLMLFSRMALVLGEKAVRYAPYIGPFISMVPIKFTTKKEGGGFSFPMIKRDKDGNKVYAYKEDPMEYAARVALSTTLTVAISMFLAAAYDDEEVLDEDGKPVADPENPGKNLVRRKYMFAEYIDFYGSNKTISPEQRGTQPINSIRIKSGTNPDGTAKYDYWSFSWLPPMLYGSLKMMGEQRDLERFYDDKTVAKMKDGKIYKTIKEIEMFDPSDVAASAALNSFNFEFSSITRLLQQIARGDGQAMFSTLVVNPGKSQVSSETAEAIEDEIYRMMDKHKIYVDSKADGSMAEYLMSDVWFTDPFISDRKNFESLDPFGNPIDFPGFVKFVPSLFSNNVFYAMAEHEQNFKKDYEVYYDNDGKYDPSVVALPKRYIFSSYTDSRGVKIEVDDRNLRRKISDDQAKKFGEYVDQYHDQLMKIDYEKRQPVLNYIHDWSIYSAIDDNIKDHTRETPKPKEAENKEVQKLLQAITIREFNKTE